MSFDISGYPIYNLTTSLNEFFYSKEILPLDTTYLVKGSGKNIIFKSFKTGSSGTSNSINVKFNSKNYGFTVVNVPRLYTINLGIEILENLTDSNDEFYVIDSKGNRVYMKFYIGIISTYGLNVTNLDADKFYHTGMSIQLNISKTDDNKLLLYSSTTEDFKFKSYIDYNGDSSLYETTVNGDIFQFEVRATEKDSSYTKSFSNSSYGWIVPLAIIGVILFVAIIYGIWMYFGNSMNIDGDSFDYPPELRQIIKDNNPKYQKINIDDSFDNLYENNDYSQEAPLMNFYGKSPMTPRYNPSKNYLPFTKQYM
jgi:hypothetical protein